MVEGGEILCLKFDWEFAWQQIETIMVVSCPALESVSFQTGDEIFPYRRSVSFIKFLVPFQDEVFADDERLLSVDDAPILKNVQHVRKATLIQGKGGKLAVSFDDIIYTGLFLG